MLYFWYRHWEIIRKVNYKTFRIMCQWNMFQWGIANQLFHYEIHETLRQWTNQYLHNALLKNASFIVWRTWMDATPSEIKIALLTVKPQTSFSLKHTIRANLYRWFHDFRWRLRNMKHLNRMLAISISLAVREITKSSSTFSATNISSNMIWFFHLHDTIKMKSNHTGINYNRNSIAIRSHMIIYNSV